MKPSPVTLFNPHKESPFSQDTIMSAGPSNSAPATSSNYRRARPVGIYQPQMSHVYSDRVFRRRPAGIEQHNLEHEQGIARRDFVQAQEVADMHGNNFNHPNDMSQLDFEHEQGIKSRDFLQAQGMAYTRGSNTGGDNWNCGPAMATRPAYFPRRTGDEFGLGDEFENSKAREQAARYYRLHGNSVRPRNETQRPQATYASHRDFTVYRDTQKNQPERSDHLYRPPQGSGAAGPINNSASSTQPRNRTRNPGPTSMNYREIIVYEATQQKQPERSDHLYSPPRGSGAAASMSNAASNTSHSPHADAKTNSSDYYRDGHGYIRKRNGSEGSGDSTSSHPLPSFYRDRRPTGMSNNSGSRHSSGEYTDVSAYTTGTPFAERNGHSPFQQGEAQNNGVQNTSGDRFQEYTTDNGDIGQAFGYNALLAGQAPLTERNLLKSKKSAPQLPNLKSKRSFWDKIKMKKSSSLDSLTGAIKGKMKKSSSFDSLTGAIKGKKSKLAAKFARVSNRTDSTKVGDPAQSGNSQSGGSPKISLAPASLDIAYDGRDPALEGIHENSQSRGSLEISFAPASLRTAYNDRDPAPEGVHENPQSHESLEISLAPAILRTAYDGRGPALESVQENSQPRGSLEISFAPASLENAYDGRDLALEGAHNNQYGKLSDNTAPLGNPVVEGENFQAAKLAQRSSLPGSDGPSSLTRTQTYNPIGCITAISDQVDVVIALGIQMARMNEVQYRIATMTKYVHKPLKRLIYEGIQALPELLKQAECAMKNNENHEYMEEELDRIATAFTITSKRLLDLFSLMVILALPKSAPKRFKPFNKGVFFELCNTRDALKNWTETLDSIIFPVPYGAKKVKLSVHWSAVQKAMFACDLWENLEGCDGV
ncbi:uncharacterized protein BP5553_08597 [Venustampulla echinocandica]|uniref:Uncharacterized protein n=1 Tax=Venustampulla echinocandica TaxID=2656787 RepID=A0A370TEN5_9HELO|nr:uncharacterized protein BP5553_08597 [Venustampulla echinocandica]RDL33158.1 hypothetical protein BP5553_08597 [Venustampulla echinocandica]